MEIDVNTLLLMIVAPLIVAAVMAVSKLLVQMSAVQKDIQYIRTSTTDAAKRIRSLESRVSAIEGRQLQ